MKITDRVINRNIKNITLVDGSKFVSIKFPELYTKNKKGKLKKIRKLILTLYIQYRKERSSIDTRFQKLIQEDKEKKDLYFNLFKLATSKIYLKNKYKYLFK